MSGKWSDPSVPKSGWTCTGTYDSCDDGDDELHRICEMCESKLIRYVHVMEHPDHETLESGCVCAGNMEGSVSAALDREARAKRRSRFHLHKNWTLTETGNWRINVEHYRLIVYRRDEDWMVGVDPRSHYRNPVWGQYRYPTLRAAKQAAFDALIYAQERNLREEAA